MQKNFGHIQGAFQLWVMEEHYGAMYSSALFALSPGSVGQLVEERGRLPEDLSLHYLHQVLGALDHLHKKRVLHLDVKGKSRMKT